MGRGHTQNITAAALSRVNNALFAITSGRDRTLKRWDLSFLNTASDKALSTTEALSSELTVRSALGHEKEVNVLAVAPDNSLIASGAADRTIALWNSNDLSKVATLKGHRRGIWSVAFSAVDKVLASASG